MNLECGEEAGKSYDQGSNSERNKAANDTNIKVSKRIVILNFIRHGYAEHNQGKDAYGTRAYFSNRYRFSELVERGRIQANELRLMMNDSIQNIDRIYTSPLDRAMQTTEIIFSENTKIENDRIYVTDDLREINYAHPCNERRSVTMLNQIYPDFNYSLMKSDRDILFANGDNYNRFVSMVREIKNYVEYWYNCGNDRAPIVVLVSHESFLLDFARNYLNVNITTIDNCELVSFEIDIDQLL